MEPNSGTAFDDVAGVDEVKQDFQEIVKFLKTPKKVCCSPSENYEFPKKFYQGEKMLLAKSISDGPVQVR